jgi:ATP-dependent protease HslVU (ClpYQ) peptidase subunit
MLHRASIESTRIDHIVIGDGRRALNMGAVDRLAESMQRLGLQVPVAVRIEDEMVIDGQVTLGVPVLVAGAHRLAAARKLGWATIETVILTAEEGEDEYRLWEIDENLARAELTATEEAEHLHERKLVWERISASENTGATCASIRGRGQPQQFAADTAASTGRSKATINRAIVRAVAVCDEARALIVGTDLDTGAYLDRLMKADPAEQVERVQRDLAAIERRRHDEALRREEAERLREAKEAREAAKRRVMDRLLNKLSPRDWDLTIADIEAAGGSLKASDMRSWMAPQTEAA